MPKKTLHLYGYEVALGWHPNTSFEMRCWVELDEALRDILLSHTDKSYCPTLTVAEAAVRRTMASRKQFSYLAAVEGTPGQNGQPWKIEVWRNLTTVGECATQSRRLWLTITGAQEAREAKETAYAEAMDKVDFHGKIFNYDTFNGSRRGDYLAVEPSDCGQGHRGVYHLNSILATGFVRFYQTEVRTTPEEAAELVERKFPAMPKINRECLDMATDRKEVQNAR